VPSRECGGFVVSMIEITDAMVDEMKAQAEGRAPFVVNRIANAVAEMEAKDYNAQPPRIRLWVGYYLAAQRRAAQMQETS
jgi:hypothetical protein